ncbi:MAG: HDIG domain-containing protein [Anaerolineales bacterium]|nr:HDIG domain-containing protein [Anaerolineales bacterium]
MNLKNPTPARLKVLQISLLVAVSLAAFVVLVIPLGLNPTIRTLAVGDVSQNSEQALKDIEYVSEIRTEEARLAAESAVQPVYSLPDPAIARQQIDRLTTTMQYISSVRDNVELTADQKKSNLVNLSDVRLRLETIDYILGISSARWQIVQSEAVRVLEQAMRRSIHEDGVDAARLSASGAVSLTLNEEQATLVTELVAAFIVPNSFFSEELTQAAKQTARDAVKPVVRTYKAGETIVSAGEIITPADMEAFDKLGMIGSGQQAEDIIGAASLILLCAVFVPLYFSRRKRLAVINDAKNLAVIALVFTLFLIAARLFTDRALAPYAFPLQAAGLLITALFGLEAGLVFTIPLCLIASYGLPNSLDLAPYYLFSSLIGLLVLGPARRFLSFLSAGLAIFLSGFLVLMAYRLPVALPDWLGALQYAAAAALCGLASASITLLLQYIFAQLLGIATSLQLLDISRPDFPLLQFFLRSAPGTYQHSLQVANLAEQAAEKIGADPLLTRVGAQFHDIGKSLNPAFFIENQVEGSINKHEDISPEESAATIIRHVTDGIGLAKKHRLPRRLYDFILEHHGTLITRYQYNQALEAAGNDATKVDVEKFRYPGPRPRSRETALLMLADATEARARAERPVNEEALRALVRSVIETVQKFHQMDDTLLTLRDLSQITESFVTTLRGTYHPRIQYPNAKVPDQDTTLVQKKEK